MKLGDLSLWFVSTPAAEVIEPGFPGSPSRSNRHGRDNRPGDRLARFFRPFA